MQTQGKHKLEECSEKNSIEVFHLVRIQNAIVDHDEFLEPKERIGNRAEPHQKRPQTSPTEEMLQMLNQKPRAVTINEITKRLQPLVCCHFALEHQLHSVLSRPMCWTTFYQISVKLYTNLSRLSLFQYFPIGFSLILAVHPRVFGTCNGPRLAFPLWVTTGQEHDQETFGFSRHDSRYDVWSTAVQGYWNECLRFPVRARAALMPYLWTVSAVLVMFLTCGMWF